MIIIGDVHGNINKYWKILQRYQGKSIQVGDFGFKEQHDWHLQNIDSKAHKINFGNHDWLPYLNEPHSCGNAKYFPHKSIMTIRGAESIDKNLRVEGKTWFKDEELDNNEWNGVIEMYEKLQPRIVVSHDCPRSIRNAFFGISDRSMTSNGLQYLLDMHRPEMWIFGHHHQSKDEEIDGTRFICLEPLQVFELQ